MFDSYLEMNTNDVKVSHEIEKLVAEAELKELRRINVYCPAYTREYHRILASDDAQKVIKENSKIFEYISKQSGIKTSTFQDITNIFQVFTSKQHMNLSLPSWADVVHPEDTHHLAAIQCALENYNAILKTLNGGRMLKKVVDNMIQKSEGSLIPRDRKLYLYSGHDNNVVSILAALNLFKPHFPKYSSATIIELYQNSTEQFNVKVVYVKDPYSNPEELHLGDCGTSCELSKFVNIAKPHLPKNYTMECESDVFLD